MDHATSFPFLRETLLFLTLTGILIPLLQRFRVNQVIGFLIIVDLLTKHSSDGVVTQIATMVLLSVGVVTFILMAGRKVVAPLFRMFAQQRQSEVFMALTLLVTLSHRWGHGGGRLVHGTGGLPGRAAAGRNRIPSRGGLHHLN